MEKKRGCGYRKIGGLYLVGRGPAASCDFLPHELTVCRHCGAGVKPTRGFTWLTRSFFGPIGCQETCENFKAYRLSSERLRPPCPFDEPPDTKFGLLWIGERYYPTPESFLEEASAMGISRRIAQIPKGLVLGETWVFLAHRKVRFLKEHQEVVGGKTLLSFEANFNPAIFYAFRPHLVEKILTKELSTDDELDSCEKRGITPVIVEDCARHRAGANEDEPESLPLSFESKERAPSY